MSLRNRVDPWGRIHSAAMRGSWMGNRGGCFHRVDQSLKAREWASEQWIYCVLDFKNRSRQMMQPGLYTELFFMDELTALAAGHRPCMECQREKARGFLALSRFDRCPQLDAILHRERLSSKALCRVNDLPNGAMFEHESVAWAKWEGKCLRWSWGGFLPQRQTLMGLVACLTPATTVKVLESGFVPNLRMASE